MIELRKDYILNRWVIISEGRKDRPREFRKQAQLKQEGVCYFCPSNESLTPKEIGRVEENGRWKIRWFLNKFPFVLAEGSPAFKRKGLFESGNAYGFHEILVETQEHDKQFSGATPAEMAAVFRVIVGRIKELSARKGIKYVAVFKNHGPDGGTSLVHSHLQVVAYNKIPTLVQEEVKKSTKGKCAYCRVIKQESKSPRALFENSSFVSFAPFASRFNYEAWVFPRKHYKSIIELSDKELTDLAEMMKKILGKLAAAINPSYNFFIHNAPKGNNLHFHIEITPRIATWAGFEFQTGEVVNSVSPESAARFYREG